MPPTPATAGSATLDATGGVIFTAAPGAACAAFAVTNRDAVSDILVNVAGLHAPGDFASIAPGASMTFGLGGQNYGSITSVFAKAATTALVNWAVVGKR